MKWLSIILSVYFAILLCIPCHDNDQPFADQNISHTTHNHTDQDYGDNCSPLCVCTCCGVVLNQATQIDYEIHNTQKIILADKIVPSTIHTVSQFLESIWQPPKGLS